jgi:hypothetical protein
MDKLTHQDLFSLEQYARERGAFRERVMAHKRNRRLSIGAHSMWLFEDRLTIQYQIQEILRTERIFEPEGIAEELAAYNPLIPDGRNWKVTLLLEYADPAVRARELARLRGVEDRCWVRVRGHEPVFAIADEDLDRENDDKTSSVHFLRFELNEEQVKSLRAGSELSAGIDHAAYRHSLEPVPEAVRESLLGDLA